MTIEKTYTEQELVSLLKIQDKVAFCYLYDKYASSFYGMIFSHLNKDEEYVQLVLQHSFMQIVKTIAIYDNKKEVLFLWMFKVVYSNIIDKVEFVSQLRSSMANYKLESK